MGDTRIYQLSRKHEGRATIKILTRFLHDRTPNERERPIKTSKARPNGMA